MDPFHFACPHCSSRLRVREKLYVGRQVDCPECGQLLLIVDEKGELAARPVERKNSPPPSAAHEKLVGKVPENASQNTPKKASGKHQSTGQPTTSGGVAVPQAKSLSPISEAATASATAKPLSGSSRRKTSIVVAGVLVLAF